jgi:hypothetical protein
VKLHRNDQKVLAKPWENAFHGISRHKAFISGPIGTFAGNQDRSRRSRSVPAEQEINARGNIHRFLPIIATTTEG